MWKTFWESNHDACLRVGVNVFRHLYAKLQISFAFGLGIQKVLVTLHFFFGTGRLKISDCTVL